MKKSTYIFFFLFVIALVIFFTDNSIAQCAMCQKVASDGVNSKVAGNSLNHGILYLMAFPYLALSFIFRKQISTFFKQFLPK